MTRRAQGEGSIFELPDGRYRASLDLGYDAATGKRVRKVWTGPTRAAVAGKLKAAVRLLDDGFALADDKLTVGAFFERWLTEAAGPTLKESALIQ